MLWDRRAVSLWFVVLTGAFVSLGCSNKSGLEGKVQVVLSERLKERGVTLIDWRFYKANKTFGVRLQANPPIEGKLHLVLSGPGLGNLRTGNMAKDINAGNWVDFGGTVAFGNPLDNFPEEGTVTVDFDPRIF